jgi:hypothetical protein
VLLLLQLLRPQLLLLLPLLLRPALTVLQERLR